MGTFNLLSVIKLIGGLAFFLYGMNLLSDGLERMVGGKLEKALKKITSHPLKALFVGIGITAAIQSSSAVTVMLVGLVNSGIMTIGQTIGVIMGSNIGTTMTAWLLTLVGVESDNIWVSLLKPANFSLIFAFVGIILIMFTKKGKKKDVGIILIGFAILMFGMELMSGAVKPLAEIPAFVNILTAFQNPILGVLAGIAITAIIQSSSASVGILQALAMTGGITYGAAIPIIMGQNIGTCITALMSSMGVGRNAKKVAVVHVTFNIIGTVVCLTVYYILYLIFRFGFAAMPIDAIGIALVHSVFNLVTTAMLLPFSKQLEKLANFIMRDKKNKNAKEGTQMLDPLLIGTPSVAIAECDSVTVKMAAEAKESVLNAMSLLDRYDPDLAEKIMQQEDQLDLYEDKLGTYLVQVSSKQISVADSRKVSKMLHAISDFERLGDHAVNLRAVFSSLSEKGYFFSEEALKEAAVVQNAIREILDLTIEAYTKNDSAIAAKVEPLEQVVDDLTDQMKYNHIQRLKDGKCSIEIGFLYSDLIANYGRISDHCSNIAVAIIELAKDSFDTHKYLTDLRHQDDGTFQAAYQQYRNKYQLPM